MRRDFLKLSLLAAARALYSRDLAESQEALTLDPRLPVYRRSPGVAGNIKSVGSDTMNNLMTLWAEAFRGFYPAVRIEIEGKGSSSAPPALIAGTANFGPMSRDMKEKEIDAFVKRFGHKPTGLAVGIDMLAVYVHKDNPIPGLTLAQVDAMFSKFRRAGAPSDVRHWGDVGMGGKWERLPISLFGRNAASGTYGYFKDHVLLGGDYKDYVQEQPGSSSVVQGVATDLRGVGYSGIGYKTADVRAVPLAPLEGAAHVPPEPKYALRGEYPLARSLWLYLNHEPGTALDPLRREFLKFIFSRQGQSEVIKDGYLPVTADIARTMLRSVGMMPDF